MILRLTWAGWNAAPSSFQDEFEMAVDDYLRRSQEEITREEEWETLQAAMMGNPTLLLLVAVEAGQLLGFCLARAQSGTAVTGPLIFVWQVYVVPGRARLIDLAKDALPALDLYMKGAGATRMVMLTRREGRGYGRLLARLGFQPYSAIYQREVLTT